MLLLATGAATPGVHAWLTAPLRRDCFRWAKGVLCVCVSVVCV